MNLVNGVNTSSSSILQTSFKVNIDFLKRFFSFLPSNLLEMGLLLFVREVNHVCCVTNSHVGVHRKIFRGICQGDFSDAILTGNARRIRVTVTVGADALGVGLASNDIPERVARGLQADNCPVGGELGCDEDHRCNHRRANDITCLSHTARLQGRP